MKSQSLGRWKALALFAIAAVVGVSVASVSNVSALPQEEFGACGYEDPLWGFVSGGTVAQRGAVKQGFDILVSVPDHQGQELVSPFSVVVDDPNNPPDYDIDVSLENLGSVVYGATDCRFGFQDTIKINNTITNSSRMFWLTARHEMMHVLGAHHTGDFDSTDGKSPSSMVICKSWTTFPTNNQVNHDDAVYLNYLHNTLPQRQLTANIGFEEDLKYWKSLNGTLWPVNATNGNDFVRWIPNGDINSGFFYQTIRLWTGDDNQSYRNRLKVRKQSSSHSAQVRTKLYRRVMIENPAQGCDQYADGVENANSPQFGGWTTLASTNPTNVQSTAYQLHSTSWNNPPTEDGFVLQVRAYGTSQIPTSGAPVPLEFDLVRAETNG